MPRADPSRLLAAQSLWASLLISMRQLPTGVALRASDPSGSRTPQERPAVPFPLVSDSVTYSNDAGEFTDLHAAQNPGERTDFITSPNVTFVATREDEAADCSVQLRRRRRRSGMRLGPLS